MLPPLVIQLAPGTAARSAAVKAGASAVDGNAAAAVAAVVADRAFTDERNAVADPEAASSSAARQPTRTNRLNLIIPPPEQDDAGVTTREHIPIRSRSLTSHAYFFHRVLERRWPGHAYGWSGRSRAGGQTVR